MKVLLFGGNGQVGAALRRSLASLGEVIVTTRDGALPDGARGIAVDLLAPSAASEAIAAHAPHVVVNAAAYTAVDKAESEPDLALRVNRDAVADIARACVSANIPLVHYSTDYVFDGRATRAYRPTDAVAPLGVYGSSKLAGEAAVRDSGAAHLILRTAWVYSLHGHNFLKTMLRLGAERDVLRVVADQIGSPTPAWLIADVTAAILKQGIGAGGTHHLVTQGQVSWHGFTEAIVREAVASGRLAHAPRIEAITTADYPTPAHRPAWSVLDTGSLRETYNIELPAWQDALHATFVRAATDERPMGGEA